MIRNYIKIAFRNLWKNKVFAFINVLGLSIGTSTCLIIFLIVNHELSFDNFWPNSEKIYRITSVFNNGNGDINYNGGISTPIPTLAQKELPGFENMLAYQVFWTKVHIPLANKKKKYFPQPQWPNFMPDIVVAPQIYFDFFPYEWIEGNAATSLNEPFSVVLTESKVKKYFGNISTAEVIGKTVIYSDSMFTKVTGVVKDLPQNTDFNVKDIISFSSIEKGRWRKQFQFDQITNTSSSSQAFIKLSANADVEKLAKSLTNFVYSKVTKDDVWSKRRSFKLQAMKDIHFDINFSGVMGRTVKMSTLYSLMAVSVFLLLMAIINFVNLNTAQTLQRSKEIGVRKVIGGSSSELITQFLAEAFIFSILSLFVAALISIPIIDLFEEFIPSSFNRNLMVLYFEPKILFFLLLLIVVTTILSGLYPAFLASKLNPISIIKNEKKRDGGEWLRKSLIVFQFVIAQMFVLGALIVAKQSNFMMTKDLGFEKDNLVSIDMDWQLDDSKRPLLLEKLKEMPELEIVSMSELVARSGYSTNSLDFEGKKIETHQKSIDNSFFDLFKLKFASGRQFLKADTVKEMIVNEAFTRAAGFKKPADALNKMVDWWNTNGGKMKIPIVGIVKDYHFQSMHNAIKPMMFRIEPKYAQQVCMKLKNQRLSVDDFKALTTKVNSVFKDVYPTYEDQVELHFLDQTIAEFYKEELKMAKLINAATGIAILISCLGLLGLTMHAVQRRFKEIGIRKVLGSSVANIVGLISKDFLILVLMGICIGSPIAYYFMNKWLEDFAFKIDISWWIFVMSAFFSVFTAFVTVSYQAIKAALMNPVKSLKTE